MPMALVDEAFTSYLEGLIPPRPPVLQEMEAYARRARFPIIGPAVGRLFYLLTRLSGARRVFELGSGYGYSTAWFAMGVRDNGGGEVAHVVWDDDLSQSARRYMDLLGLGSLVRFHVGEAVEALRRSRDEYDIIFSDIDKGGYPASLPVIKRHLKPGGVLLADNMSWSGRVADRRVTDPETEGIRAFTRSVFADLDFVSTIVPLRDGVLVARRGESAFRA